MKKLTYKQLSDTNLYVSEVGFGSYRISSEEPTHRDALKHALQSGINFIDTSSNYADGLSEQCIGKVLYELFEDNHFKRDDIVVMTKGGYLQGRLLEHSNDLNARGDSFPDRVVISKHLEHCIHPKCLDTQLNQSLSHLGLEYVDIYLLHNPEYYLGLAKEKEVDLEDARHEFYKRIELAFRFLEEQVSNGKIKYYGVSSNTLGYKEESFEFVSVEKLLHIAKRISKNHHFKVIQTPLNIIENNAAVEKNNAGLSAIEYAEQHTLAVITNRPINAILNNQLFRLVDYETEEGISWIEVDEELQNLLQLEMQIDQLDIESLPLKEEEISMIKDTFRIGAELQANWQAFQSVETWKESMNQFIYPRVDFAIARLFDTTLLTREQEGWLSDYIELLNAALKAITLFLKVQSANYLDNLRLLIREKEEKLIIGKTFSQTAISYLRGVSGVTSSLVGLRRTEYVDDILFELIQPALCLNPREIPNSLQK